MKRYSIYVGLKDAGTHQQVFQTEKYTAILKSVCKNYHVGFSFAEIQGGYVHEDGNLADETTLYISLFNAEEQTVNEIAADLCTFFNQECVMITEGEVAVRYINGNREVQETINATCRKPEEEKRKEENL